MDAHDVSMDLSFVLHFAFIVRQGKVQVRRLPWWANLYIAIYECLALYIYCPITVFDLYISSYNSFDTQYIVTTIQHWSKKTCTALPRREVRGDHGHREGDGGGHGRPHARGGAGRRVHLHGRGPGSVALRKFRAQFDVLVRLHFCSSKCNCLQYVSVIGV